MWYPYQCHGPYQVHMDHFYYTCAVVLVFCYFWCSLYSIISNTSRICLSISWLEALAWISDENEAWEGRNIINMDFVDGGSSSSTGPARGGSPSSTDPAHGNSEVTDILDLAFGWDSIWSEVGCGDGHGVKTWVHSCTIRWPLLFLYKGLPESNNNVNGPMALQNFLALTAIR